MKRNPLSRNPFANRRLAGGIPVKAFNTTPTVLAMLALISAIHVLQRVPWEPLQFMLLNMAFEPLRFLALFLGLDVGSPLPILLSPLTHALLHVDIVHLLINGAFLLAFGTEIDRRMGSWRFLLLFALCAIGGAMAVELRLLMVEKIVIVIGASGAISGLFGALVRPMPSHRLLLVGSFVAINVVIGFTGFPGANGIQMVAWDAHVGGFFTGFLLQPLFRRRGEAP